MSEAEQPSPPEAQPAEARPSSSQKLAQTLVFGRNPRRTLIRICVLVVSVFVLFRFVLLLVRIEGVSMFPAAKEGEVHCILRTAYLWEQPKRFDVVAVEVVRGGPVLLKRVIGMPGEEIGIKHGLVQVNGHPLTEPHVKARLPWNHNPVRLGPAEYFVVGDNRTMETAGHSHGWCDRRDIIGKLLF